MYKITIEEITKEMQTLTKYETLREPYPDEKDRFGNRTERENDPQYGYVKHEEEVKVEKTILEQTVDELDIPEVIKAINKL